MIAPTRVRFPIARAFTAATHTRVTWADLAGISSGSWGQQESPGSCSLCPREFRRHFARRSLKPARRCGRDHRTSHRTPPRSSALFLAPIPRSRPEIPIPTASTIRTGTTLARARGLLKRQCALLEEQKERTGKKDSRAAI